MLALIIGIGLMTKIISEFSSAEEWCSLGIKPFFRDCSVDERAEDV